MNTFTISKAVRVISAIMLIFSVSTAVAQEKIKTKTIGNKPRNGSSNSTYAVKQGSEVGIKMKAGSKPVQLLKLNFGAENFNADSLKFKVNVYDFSGDKIGEKVASSKVIGVVPKGKSRINVDLSSDNITVKGTILVSIEWLQAATQEMSYSIGLFNGGTYHKDAVLKEWEKTPIAGVDFNVLVKKL